VGAGVIAEPDMQENHPELGQALSRNLHGGPGLRRFRKVAEFFSPSGSPRVAGAAEFFCHRADPEPWVAAEILQPLGDPRAAGRPRDSPATGEPGVAGTAEIFLAGRGAQNGREREASRGP